MPRSHLHSEPPGNCRSLLAIDVGNSRVKLGRFDRSADCQQAAQARSLPIAGPRLAEPTDTVSVAPPLDAGSPSAQHLAHWIAEQMPESGSAEVQFVIASVNRGVATALESLLGEFGQPVQLSYCDLPLEIRAEHPERVGIDRLLGAVAANRLRQPEQPAIVVDLGTAITVDLIMADGGFEGGAILPGIAMAGRALHQQTDALPPSRLEELEASPDAVGKNTADAIEAGLFWGAVGAVRELIARQSDRLTRPPQVLLTGGAAPSVARLLAGPDYTVRYLPHLVLSGIAATCEWRETEGRLSP